MGAGHFAACAGGQGFIAGAPPDGLVGSRAVGFIAEPKQADDIIRNGQADVVLLARQMLVDPYWPVRAAQALGQKDQLPPPNRYARAW